MSALSKRMQTPVSWIFGHHFELEGIQPHE